MNNKSIKAVLFDFDGVIINSLPVMRLSLEAALREVYPNQDMDFEFIFSQYRLHLGKGFKQIMSALNLSETTYEPFRKHSTYLAPYINLVPGMMDVLKWCQDNQINMAIATGKDFQRTQQLLIRLHINHFFQEVYAADTVKNCKPAPDMAIMFCEKQKISPQELLMIGDAEADIKCGKSAGSHTAFVNWGYGEMVSLADAVLQTPKDIPELIESMNNSSRAVS